MYEENETLKRMESLQQEVEYLRGRVTVLEAQQPVASESDLPNTWLLSPNLLKRAFGVYGHNLLAGFLIAIPFLCLYFLLILVFGLSFGNF